MRADVRDFSFRLDSLLDKQKGRNNNLGQLICSGDDHLFVTSEEGGNMTGIPRPTFIPWLMPSVGLVFFEGGLPNKAPTMAFRSSFVSSWR
jgi:hypothetical protein